MTPEVIAKTSGLDVAADPVFHAALDFGSRRHADQMGHHARSEALFYYFRLEDHNYHAFARSHLLI